jgi:hypothetical protein
LRIEELDSGSSFFSFRLRPAGFGATEKKLVRNDVEGKRCWKIIAVLLLLTALCAPCPVKADNSTPSLFFTNDEMQTIEAAVQKSAQQHPSDNGEDVTLGAVLYYGPENWSVWLQGERWTPTTNKPNLHIVDVAADHVRLSVTPLSGGTPQEITLRPHQTYSLVSNQTRENGETP